MPYFFATFKIIPFILKLCMFIGGVPPLSFLHVCFFRYLLGFVGLTERKRFWVEENDLKVGKKGLLVLDCK